MLDRRKFAADLRHVVKIEFGRGESFACLHLGEHLASSEPVRVWFREESGELVAYRIEDAGG